MLINLLLNHNPKNIDNADNDINMKLSYDNLYKEFFNLFKFMAFVAINKFNDINNKEKSHVIKIIFTFIIKILNDYVNDMNNFKNGKKRQDKIINEEKLNSFLILLYRCILKNNICDIIKKYYNNIFTIIFIILFYSSMKNKIMSLKIIEIIFFNDMKNDDLVKNNINIFEKELKENNRSLYDFMNAHNVKHIDNIFIEFLFNYTLLLQQKDKHKKKYIYFTENDKLLSLIIIKMIQNKLL
jgi:hypothetical protein